ncbi:Serine/threonine protein kinase [Trema orientale]|uniref:non-specific serine/threonine protein kinase n=1 Tax=Trema orientale TaxID=63057 RepID=A0A2P5E6F7_TREOI|nr:Serine/threonine protein kinase [Trema orientale]
MASLTNPALAWEIFSFLFYLILVESLQNKTNFVYNGFFEANLSFDGASSVRSNGILAITNDTAKLLGHAFYPTPLEFKKVIPGSNKPVAVNFSTNFVFSILPKYPGLGGHGLTFVLASKYPLKDCLPNQYLGLPNVTSNSQFSTRVLANLELQDINDNQVGIDISSLMSNICEPAALQELLNASLSPLGMGRPSRPLILFLIDLSRMLDEYTYVGFSASTGLLSAAHYVHGWSFRIGGRAIDLDPRELPTLPTDSKELVQGFKVGITLASVAPFILVIFAGVHILHTIINKDEIVEDWEVEYGARRFKYSKLHSATRGFGKRNLIGSGGFGKVYMGWFPVQVPNGSLGKLLFDNENQKKKLTSEERYKILTHVARVLLYRHQECQQMVVHRDLKPSNILIDANLNAKLGDFGLARIYEHGNNPDTANIVGTPGYMAPELTRTGKATSSTDVYSYGILLLEVACGRRPIEPHKNAGELVLVDWVREQHCRGDNTRAVDPTFDDYDPEEDSLVLSLGLFCSHSHPDCRPSMGRIVHHLQRDASLPTLPTDIHVDHPKVMMEYSDSFPDDSDPSCCRMTSSKSNSFTSFDKKVSVNKSTSVSF